MSCCFADNIGQFCQQMFTARTTCVRSMLNWIFCLYDLLMSCLRLKYNQGLCVFGYFVGSYGQKIIILIGMCIIKIEFISYLMQIIVDVKELLDHEQETKKAL